VDRPPLIRVLLADRPGSARTAVAELLMATPDVVLVATVDDANMVEAAMSETQPDLVLVDDRLLRDERWNGRHRRARLIVMGVDDNPGYPARAARIGAEAWVPKEQAAAMLTRLLAPVLPGAL
jgi:DNA-binding NarL/FixJ family response regulator